MIEQNKIAIIDWTHCIEDYLSNIGLTIDDFADKMQGGWLFGYIEALKLAGFEPVFFCFSKQVVTIQSRLHKPSNSEIRILPSPKFYQIIRKKILNPYTQNIFEAVEATTSMERFFYNFFLKLSPYLATPIRQLKNILRQEGFIVILCQEYEHARFDVCNYIGKSLKIPVFATFQGGNWQLSPYEKYLRPYSLRHAKGLIIASSEEKLRVLKKYPFLKNKIFTIFNPLEVLPVITQTKNKIRENLSIPLDAKVAIWHGRIDFHRKGLDTLIDTWCGVKTNNALLYIIGNGTEHLKLEKKLEEVQNKNIIWIQEFIQDRQVIFNYLRAADIYIFLSRNEGFPVAPIEAMASGLPVIATQVQGISEILHPLHESGGILLPIDCLPNDISQIVDEVFESKEILIAKGEKAKNHVQNKFSMASMASLFKKVF